MRISKKAEYAIRALAILASRSPQSPMQIQELADQGQIPSKFLEQILLVLKRSGLLRSKRGLGGGYQLNQSADAITLAHVIELLDGKLTRHDPAAASSDPIGSRALRQCLSELDQITLDYLQRQTVATLLHREDPDGVLAFDI